MKGGAQNSPIICFTDFMATCADILGAKLPDNASKDSISILPALLGTGKAPLRESVVHHSIAGKFSIGQAQWKLELCPGSGGWGKPGDAGAVKQGMPDIQLYDLSTDPGETKNVQRAHPDIVERLTALLEATVTTARSTPGGKQSNDADVKVFKANGKVLKE